MPWKSLYKTEKNLLDAYFNAMKRISMKPGKTYKDKDEIIEHYHELGHEQVEDIEVIVEE